MKAPIVLMHSCQRKKCDQRLSIGAAHLPCHSPSRGAVVSPLLAGREPPVRYRWFQVLLLHHGEYERQTRPQEVSCRDPVVWSFLGLALVLTAAMIAFVALRYDSFPQRITLHFGPAGASQRDRIGERQELWTIPFLSVIVLVANTALAFVFDFFDRHDRFVPRLLAMGSALVSAVAWVVLLTLLYR